MFPEISPGTAAVLAAVITGTTGLLIQYFRGRGEGKRDHVDVLRQENESLHRTVNRLENALKNREEKLEIWKVRHKKCADEYHDATGSTKHYHGFITEADEGQTEA